jgi:hypothetical protein
VAWSPQSPSLFVVHSGFCQHYHSCGQMLVIFGCTGLAVRTFSWMWRKGQLLCEVT